MKKKGNSIGWCDITVNPVTGCPRGCEYCYARGMNDRFKWVEDFSKPQFFPNRLKDFRTKECMIIFIDSMSDIGHWHDAWLYEVCEAIQKNPQNIYLALTKNYNALEKIKFLRNAFKDVPLFIGATVTNNEQAQAVIDAGGADFISFEPLLEWIDYNLLIGLTCKWWIVGDLTKSGVPQGVVKEGWVRNIAARAFWCGIPVFMKDSLRGLMGTDFKQEFPEGWKP